MIKLTNSLDRFKSNEELKAYNAFLETIDDDYFKKFKTADEMDEHVEYLNSRKFIDDLMQNSKK